MKAKQKTDVNANGYYEFMDPWGRPYMYRAYPQPIPFPSNPTAATYSNSAPWTVTLPLPNMTGYNLYTFYMDTPLANTLGTIQLAGFSPAIYNGTFTFVGSTTVPYAITLTFQTQPPPITVYGYCTFPLHNPQSCDIYSLGPYGLTRAAGSIPNTSNPPQAQEWKPTHGGSTADPATPSLDPTSLDAWPQVWGTSGDGNDINSNTGNVIVNSLYQDNISNWQ